MHFAELSLNSTTGLGLLFTNGQKHKIVVHIKQTMAAAAPNGSKVIGSGSQGCIMYPKLKYNETTNTASANAANENISKIFYDKDTFDQEVDFLQQIQPIAGKGIVDIKGMYHTVGKGLNAASFNSIRTSAGSACNRIHSSLKSGKPIYFFNQTRIDSDFFKLKDNGETYPFSFFTDAFEALIKLKEAKYAHLDMAARNLFFKNGEGALIGDFGYSIHFAETPETKLARHAGQKQIEDTGLLHAIAQCDQMTPEAWVGLTILSLWSTRRNFLKGELILLYLGNMAKYHRPIEFRDGSIAIQNTLYEEFMNVVFAALTMTKDVFLNYVIFIVLSSDIKNYVRIILPHLSIPEEEKQVLMRSIWVNDNYDAFYHIVGQVDAPDFVKAATLKQVAEKQSYDRYRVWNFEEQLPRYPFVSNEAVAKVLIAACKSDEALPFDIDSLRHQIAQQLPILQAAANASAAAPPAVMRLAPAAAAAAAPPAAVAAPPAAAATAGNDDANNAANDDANNAANAAAINEKNRKNYYSIPKELRSAPHNMLKYFNSTIKALRLSEKQKELLYKYAKRGGNRTRSQKKQNKRKTRRNRR